MSQGWEAILRNISVFDVKDDDYLPGEKHSTGVITCFTFKTQADYFESDGIPFSIRRQ